MKAEHSYQQARHKASNRHMTSLMGNFARFTRRAPNLRPGALRRRVRHDAMRVALDRLLMSPAGATERPASGWRDHLRRLARGRP